MDVEPRNPRWQGKSTVEFSRATADFVWSLLQDFFNIHKWLPSIDTCSRVEGAGTVRYCASSQMPHSGVKWCLEELVAVDPMGKWLRYRVGDNNMDLRNYEATIRVMEIDGVGCRIEWSFSLDPMEGLKCEDMFNYLEISLRGMADNIEKEFEKNSQI